jgi:hypothetical protein
MLQSRTGWNRARYCAAYDAKVSRGAARQVAAVRRSRGSADLAHWDLVDLIGRHFKQRHEV